MPLLLLGTDKLGVPVGVHDRAGGESLNARLVTESIPILLRSILLLCGSIIRVASAPCEVSEVANCALKNGQVWVINSFSSKNKALFGGIPSGHSVRARPLNTSVIVLIFVGFRSLRIRLPLRIAGARSVYSEGSNPVRYNTGSER